MRHHNEADCIRILKALGVRVSGKSLKIPTGTLGNKAWGRVDYLCKIHHYTHING